MGREHIIEGYYARGKLGDCLQKKSGIIFDSRTGESVNKKELVESFRSVLASGSVGSILNEWK